MKIGYIQEQIEEDEILKLKTKFKNKILKNDIVIKFLVKIKIFLQEKIIFFTKEKRQGRLYIYLPCLITNSKRKVKIWEKRLTKKVENELKKEQISKVVLSKKLDKIQILHDMLEKSGKLLGHCMLLKQLDYEIIEYITKNKGIFLELQDIYICTNRISKENINKLEKWVNKVKTLNIVTKYPNKFASFEKTMLYKCDNIITISNNAKKALAKAKYIVNWDFSNDEINEFNINREAIFLDTTQKVRLQKSFQGINIQDIALEQKETIFDEETYIESEFLNGRFSLNNEDMKISKLYGIYKRLIRL